jgi:putative peptide zinc metalloprotease protein
MNLFEALQGTLPDTPARKRKKYVKVHPRIVWQNQVHDGQPIVMAVVPGVDTLFTFTPVQWQLVQLFDGKKSYDEVAAEFSEQTGAPFEESDVREMIATLDEMSFFYESEHALTSNVREQRQHRLKKKEAIDLAMIIITTWDPDKWITWLHDRMRWIYTRQFFLFSLCAFLFTGLVFATNWGQIGRDTLQYYTFTEKSGSDLLEFWLLFFILAGFHETAHALSSKHFGAGVHKMGILLLYLNIGAFFVDVTEAWLYTKKWQRLTIMIAGIWIELLICSGATALWWGTATGSLGHELAYKIMLITGVAVVIINLNPLIKADGYLIFCELFGLMGLKEESTAFVSAWVQKNIFRLPVDVPAISRRMRRIYVPYALLSGLYSYLLLYAVARLAFNIFKSFSTEWAFVPAVILGFLIFKSRLRTLERFMQTVYLDKKDRLRQWLTPPRLAAVAVVVAIFVLAPIWRETVPGRYVLEPVSRAVLRTEVPGVVTKVFAEEGAAVQAGTPVMTLRNLDLESKAAKAFSDSDTSRARAFGAQLQYANYAAADQERLRAEETSRVLRDQVSRLELHSPISGIVLTPRVQDRVGAYLPAGTEVVEIGDISTMRAWVYVPESEMRDIRVGNPVSFHVEGYGGSRVGTVKSIAPASSEIEAGLMPKLPYKGLRPPGFYHLEVLLPNPGLQLYSGLAGDAKVFVRRRSLAMFVWQAGIDFAGRKIW